MENARRAPARLFGLILLAPLWLAVPGRSTAQGLTIPYYKSYTNLSAIPVFSITNTGIYHAAQFQINNATGGVHDHALYVLSNGPGETLFGTNSGTGQAGHFETGAGNPSASLYSLAAGTGQAGHFEIGYASDPSEALYVLTSGTGAAGSFNVVNTANSQDALYATTFGTGYAFHSYVNASGSGGKFEVAGTGNPNNALTVSTAGSGYALSALSSGAGDTVYSVSAGTGYSVHGYANGSGKGARFEIAGSGNSNVAMTAASAGSGTAVFGQATGTGRAGLFQVSAAANSSPALEADVNSGTGYALRAVGNSNVMGQTPLAADLEGNVLITSGMSVYGATSINSSAGITLNATNGSAVTITGILTKPGGSFLIDDPLDKQGKLLYHSFVESPDMKNVYDGVVTTDGQGYATVVMDAYIEALNRDFRYQLTVVGQFAQAIIAKELQNGQFTIRTDKPNVKVCWQLTGIRQDDWANAHRIPVEVDKPAEMRGKYLYPSEAGASPTLAVYPPAVPPTPEVAVPVPPPAGPPSLPAPPPLPAPTPLPATTGSRPAARRIFRGVPLPARGHLPLRHR